MLCLPFGFDVPAFAQVAGQSADATARDARACRARARRIARGDGVADRPVLRVGSDVGVPVQGVAGEPLEIGIDAQVEQLADAAHQHAFSSVAAIAVWKLRSRIRTITLTLYLAERCHLGEDGIEPSNVCVLGLRAASSATALSMKARARRISKGPSTARASTGSAVGRCLMT